ncbi:hypothetical protein ATJ93_2810 [Halopiger aswanensis]|uniref:Uncharacterized protein n=1 Tax=Halopiger aswanensis TaxID=148449 RepID=A0A3R7HJF6_9EURY|nr:hypothetical protein ATJ93_2810 [Halopiger aswanensis]
MRYRVPDAFATVLAALESDHCGERLHDGATTGDADGRENGDDWKTRTVVSRAPPVLVGRSHRLSRATYSVPVSIVFRSTGTAG